MQPSYTLTYECNDYIKEGQSKVSGTGIGIPIDLQKGKSDAEKKAVIFFA